MYDIHNKSLHYTIEMGENYSYYNYLFDLTPDIWKMFEVNSLSASLLLNIFLSFEVGIAHAIANFKWKENTSSLKN